MGYSRYLRHKRVFKANEQRTLKLHKESLDKIQSHKDTKLISPADFESAFSYVDNRFPKGKVREAKVYVAKRSLLDRIGYRGVGGFYSRVEKIVVIPDEMPSPKIPSGKGKDRWKTIKANLTPEEILVHELCHYVSGQTCATNRSLQIEEEFAYGNMVDFCRMRGRTDDQIIRDIFMPYLVNIIMPKKATIVPQNDEEDRVLFEAVTTEAMALGKKIIEIWDNKNNGPSEEPSTETDTPKTLKLDFE